MKIICDVSVINRIQPNVPRTSQNATLAIGVHPPGNKINSELFIMLFTKQNKTGTRYKVKDNLNKVFTRFLDHGKITLSFKIPDHDIQVKCDKIQLKGFLQVLKLGIEDKSKVKQLSSLSCVPVSANAIAPTKLVIKRRGEYPIKGFPRTISSLFINGIGLCKFDLQILFLKNLTILNMNGNKISSLPDGLGNLKLTEIDMSDNSLNTCSNWNWLEGENLRRNLKSINLSDNEISYFVCKLINLENLVKLRLDNNNITRLPFGIRKMTSLRFLSLAHNNLKSVPETLNNLRLDTIDLSGNILSANTHTAAEIKTQIRPGVFKLWELAGRVIVQKNIPYSSASIPKIMVDILDQTPICSCGLICYSSKIYNSVKLLKLKCISTVMTINQTLYGDSVFCSPKCVSKLN